MPIVLRLLELNVDVNAANMSKYIPLHIVSFNVHLEVALLLLDKGAGLNVKDTKDGIAPLL